MRALSCGPDRRSSSKAAVFHWGGPAASMASAGSVNTRMEVALPFLLRTSHAQGDSISAPLSARGRASSYREGLVTQVTDPETSKWVSEKTSLELPYHLPRPIVTAEDRRLPTGAKR